MELRVETYSGYKSDERPLRFEWRGRKFEVIRILDRWYEPDALCFRVLADDETKYVLRRRSQGAEAEDWTLQTDA